MFGGVSGGVDAATAALATPTVSPKSPAISSPPKFAGPVAPLVRAGGAAGVDIGMAPPPPLM
eukprot:30802-Pelagococcus_subviridis.AAC.11